MKAPIRSAYTGSRALHDMNGAMEDRGEPVAPVVDGAPSP